MHRSRNVALILAVTLAAALADASWASGKGKTEKLTGVVTQGNYHNHKHNTNRYTVALRRGAKAVGKITFPHCEGSSSAVYCGGEMRLKGLGSGLRVLFTWVCSTTTVTKCSKSGTSLYIDNKSGKSFGSITFKTSDLLKKGEHFPVIVTLS